MAKLAPEEKLRRIRKDIVVKLSKVFDNCIVSNTGYVFNYEPSTDSAPILAVLKSEWMNILFPVFEESKDVVFVHVTSMNDLKKAIDGGSAEPVELITREPGNHESRDTQMAFDRMLKFDCMWMQSNIPWVPINISDKDLDLMYDDNMAINLPGVQDCKGHSVTVGKSMFPYTNKSNVNDVCMVSMGVLRQGVYSMSIQTDTVYFTIFTQYVFI